MRFVFKTSYAQDLRLFRDGVERNCYAALLVALARAARADAGVPRRPEPGLHLRPVRPLPDGARRLHRARQPWPRRVPRHRRLCPRLLRPGPGPAVGGGGGAGGGGDGGDRGAGGPARPAHDRRVPDDRHPRLRPDHPGGADALGPGDGRPQGQAGGQARHLRHPLRQRRGLLLPVPGVPGRRPVAHPQPAALADRSGLGGHPRQRDRRAVDGRQPGLVQDHGLRLLGRPDGRGRRALRPQDRLPGARHLQRAALDPVPPHGGGGRPRQPPRRRVRRRLRGPAPGPHLGGAGRAAGVVRPGRSRCSAAGRRSRVPGGRPLRQAARPRAGHLRPDPRAVHPASSRSASMAAG